jgi:hypothetical protein
VPIADLVMQYNVANDLRILAAGDSDTDDHVPLHLDRTEPRLIDAVEGINEEELNVGAVAHSIAHPPPQPTLRTAAAAPTDLHAEPEITSIVDNLDTAPDDEPQEHLTGIPADDHGQRSN